MKGHPHGSESHAAERKPVRIAHEGVASVSAARSRGRHLLVALTAVVLATPGEPGAAEGDARREQAPMAVARIRGMGDSHVSGILTFRETGAGIRITGKVEGVPQRAHTFRIYETNECDCQGSDCAGGILDPESEIPEPVTKSGDQAGDFGAMTPDADGEIELSFVRKDLRFHGPERGIIGRAIALHAASPEEGGPDVSEPRIGCGVIQLQSRDPID